MLNPIVMARYRFEWANVAGWSNSEDIGNFSRRQFASIDFDGQNVPGENLVEATIEFTSLAYREIDELLQF